MARLVRIFVSSPNDVQAERDNVDKAVARVNRSDGQRLGVLLQTFCWEQDVAPQNGPRPQDVIDEQTPACDIYLGIMASRFGTPTSGYGSGTEKELQVAVDKWGESGSPWILFYFHSRPPVPQTVQASRQFTKVLQFRERLEKIGIVGTYDSVDEGENSLLYKLTGHLQDIVRRLATPPDDEQPRQPSPPEPTIPPEYTEWLLGRCGEVELMGLELKHGSGVRLNHVYTPLATSSRPEETGRGQRQRGDEMVPGDQESKQLLLALLDEQSLYVSGDPGSGKSTFCRWVTWLVCHGEMPPADVPTPGEDEETFPDRLRGRLPVLVRLRDFWQHLPPDGIRSVALGSLEHALEVWLADQKYPGLNWVCLKGHLDRGRALLLLDGVDEVPPVRTTNGDTWYPREMLLAGFAEAVTHWTQAGNRVLVTSRPYGLNNEQQRKLALHPAPILGLDQKLQALLVRRWFLRLKEDPRLGQETANAMLDHIHVERGLDHLAGNPLLLTAMCIIYDEGKRLPHDKYTLYDRIVDTVLHKRYAQRESIDVIRGRLAAVALGMHTGTEQGQQREAPEAFATAREIDRVLESYHQLDGSTDAGLRDIASVREDLLSQSGLLVDRGDEGASFYHLSIQEFLAAERLFLLHGRDQAQLAELLMLRGQTDGWRNTLSFVFGGLVATFKPHAGVEYLKEIVRRLESSASDSLDRGWEPGIWNSVVVLGDCLQILTGRKAETPAELTSFFQTCVFQAIDQEIAVKQRHTLAVALGQLGDPRVAADLRLTGHPNEHPGYVEIPAGKYKIGDNDKSKYYEWAPPKDEDTIAVTQSFWLSQYPVTNSQYALFVTDGGYSRQEFWSEEGWEWIQREDIKAPAYWRQPNFNAPNQPVVMVSWWEAEAFCRWAGVRLPTEQQWEIAARGPQGFDYPWGMDWEDGICNSHEAGLGRTSAVGIFPRSLAFSLEDLAGNVWEWCSDVVEATDRVIRGGGWASGARSCRAAYRYRGEPQYRDDSLGFRVAAVPPGGPSQAQETKQAEPGA